MVAIAGPGWRLAPSLVLYVAEIGQRFPLRDTTSDGSIGDAAHASRESDHNPFEGWVHAVDIDEDVAPGIDLAPLWTYFITERDPRIRYLIYEGRIVKSYVDSAGHAAWRPYPYTGINAHEHHLHLSIERTAEARDDRRRWGIEAAFPRSSPPPPQEDDDMTPYIIKGTGYATRLVSPPFIVPISSTTEKALVAKRVPVLPLTKDEATKLVAQCVRALDDADVVAAIEAQG